MRWTATWAAVLVSSLFLAACSGSGYSYVKNSDLGAYLKVPDSWTTFEEDDVLETQRSEVTPTRLEEIRESGWLVAFDAAPSADVPSELLTAVVEHPAGFVRVRTVSAVERDQLSLAMLRKEVIDVDALLELGRAEVREVENVTIGGLRGNRIVSTLDLDSGFYTFEQVAVVDDGTSDVYVLFIGCSAECFEASRGAIDDVIDSLTIEK